MNIRKYLGRGVKILHQGDPALGLYALYKPPGIVSHRDPGGKAAVSLIDPKYKYNFTKEFFGTPEGPIHLCHRLDKETSGVMIVSTDLKVATAIKAAFRERSVVKIYKALCFGRFDGKTELPCLWRDMYVPAGSPLSGSRLRKSQKMLGIRLPKVFPTHKNLTKGGKMFSERYTHQFAPSERSSNDAVQMEVTKRLLQAAGKEDSGLPSTEPVKKSSKHKNKVSYSRKRPTFIDLEADYVRDCQTVITKAEPCIVPLRFGLSDATLAPASMVTLAPMTGFKHQLRLVLQARGLPIVGDPLYGNFELQKMLNNQHKRMYLHAQSIEINYELDGAPHVFAASSFHHDDYREPDASAYRQGWDIALENLGIQYLS